MIANTSRKCGICYLVMTVEVVFVISENIEGSRRADYLNFYNKRVFKFTLIATLPEKFKH
jgi:hypothetical protein